MGFLWLRLLFFCWRAPCARLFHRKMPGQAREGRGQVQPSLMSSFKNCLSGVGVFSFWSSYFKVGLSPNSSSCWKVLPWELSLAPWAPPVCSSDSSAHGCWVGRKTGSCPWGAHRSLECNLTNCDSLGCISVWEIIPEKFFWEQRQAETEICSYPKLPVPCFSGISFLIVGVQSRQLD